MAADEMDEALEIFGALQRRAVALVEPENFIAIKICKAENVADVEGRLVEIFDQKSGFGGVGNEEV
jgi:hypothetical protein